MWKVYLLCCIFARINVGWGILEGKPSTPHSRPYVVQVYSTATTVQHGVIINPCTVLIKARRSTQANLTVIKAGKHYTRQAEPTVQTRDICSFANDPNYDKSGKYSWALVHLNEPFAFNKYVSAIKLAPEDYNPSGDCTLIGYGSTSGDIRASSIELNEQVVKFQDMKPNPKVCGPYGHETSICIEKGACVGDEGAPLVCKEGVEEYAYGLAIGQFDKCHHTWISKISKLSRQWLSEELEKATNTCGCSKNVIPPSSASACTCPAPTFDALSAGTAIKAVVAAVSSTNSIPATPTTTPSSVASFPLPAVQDIALPAPPTASGSVVLTPVQVGPPQLQHPGLGVSPHLWSHAHIPSIHKQLSSSPPPLASSVEGEKISTIVGSPWPTSPLAIIASGTGDLIGASSASGPGSQIPAPVASPLPQSSPTTESPTASSSAAKVVEALDSLASPYLTSVTSAVPATPSPAAPTASSQAIEGPTSAASPPAVGAHHVGAGSKAPELSASLDISSSSNSALLPPPTSSGIGGILFGFPPTIGPSSSSAVQSPTASLSPAGVSQSPGPLPSPQIASTSVYTSLDMPTVSVPVSLTSGNVALTSPGLGMHAPDIVDLLRLTSSVSNTSPPSTLSSGISAPTSGLDASVPVSSPSALTASSRPEQAFGTVAPLHLSSSTASTPFTSSVILGKIADLASVQPTFAPAPKSDSDSATFGPSPAAEIPTNTFLPASHPILLLPDINNQSPTPQTQPSSVPKGDERDSIRIESNKTDIGLPAIGVDASLQISSPAIPASSSPGEQDRGPVTSLPLPSLPTHTQTILDGAGEKLSDLIASTNQSAATASKSGPGIASINASPVTAHSESVPSIQGEQAAGLVASLQLPSFPTPTPTTSSTVGGTISNIVDLLRSTPPPEPKSDAIATSFNGSLQGSSSYAPTPTTDSPGEQAPQLASIQQQSSATLSLPASSAVGESISNLADSLHPTPASAPDAGSILAGVNGSVLLPSSPVLQPSIAGEIAPGIVASPQLPSLPTPTPLTSAGVGEAISDIVTSLGPTSAPEPKSNTVLADVNGSVHVSTPSVSAASQEGEQLPGPTASLGLPPLPIKTPPATITTGVEGNASHHISSPSLPSFPSVGEQTPGEVPSPSNLIFPTSSSIAEKLSGFISSHIPTSSPAPKSDSAPDTSGRLPVNQIQSSILPPSSAAIAFTSAVAAQATAPPAQASKRDEDDEWDWIRVKVNRTDASVKIGGVDGSLGISSPSAPTSSGQAEQTPGLVASLHLTSPSSPKSHKGSEKQRKLARLIGSLHPTSAPAAQLGTKTRPASSGISTSFSLPTPTTTHALTIQPSIPEDDEEWEWVRVKKNKTSRS